MSHDLSFWSLIGEASVFVKLIMLILLGLILVAAGIAGKKWMRFVRIQRKCKQFERQFWSGNDISSFYQALKSQPTEGLESLFVAGFAEFKQFGMNDLKDDGVIITNCRRAMSAAISRELDKQEELLPILATTGSVSPYIGLLGTVYGIMMSFLGLGAVQTVSINDVAPGIAEALIATAMGLLAAIPAVLAYNYFITRSERLNVTYETFTEEFINILQRQILKAKTQSKSA
ncbi:protein TolQ [Ostreibacterium oceani]|uniref:Protein TolQ n=1 Tax=Ostreibacterium oceani TaxID=2654998 RepID=A0A6N7EX30_9GAMM|nr:protein TolQ [Ostreibacterium oceani]MPV86135.1 protein TolQ [Ostreibacterium oceani]